MKEWQTNLIGSVIVILIGLGSFAFSMSIYIPSQYKTFLGIPYDVNSEYIFALNRFITFLILGIFLFGCGLGLLANTYSLYRLERKLDNMRVTASTEKKFCQQCGKENKHDANFCINCGKAF